MSQWNVKIKMNVSLGYNNYIQSNYQFETSFQQQ